MLLFDTQQIGNRLLAIRKRLGLTQSEAAELCGLSGRAYADIERGEVNMRIQTVQRICRAFHITPDEILTAQRRRRRRLRCWPHICSRWSRTKRYLKLCILPICKFFLVCGTLKEKPPPGGKEQHMNEYEVLIETVNPCGGEAHAKKEFKEVFAESPESYVAQNGRYPVIDSGKNAAGDSVITTGDGKGILIRYTFTE